MQSDDFLVLTAVLDSLFARDEEIFFVFRVPFVGYRSSANSPLSKFTLKFCYSIFVSESDEFLSASFCAELLLLMTSAHLNIRV